MWPPRTKARPGRRTTTVDAHTDYPEGWLLEGTAEATVRFYGDSYTEGGNAKSVSLMKYNYNDSWSPDNAGTGHRFTHKENMSWNLFGSPYLCAMNYNEMAYGADASMATRMADTRR